MNRDRPNIVLITTDDQNTYDLEHMPRTLRLLGGRGFEFTRALSPHPLCCPARAGMLTGQYGHNNGVQHNGGRHGGYQALRAPANTLPAWLSESGYATAMVGKYINGYQQSSPAPAGWDHWNPTVAGGYDYRGATFLNDGNPLLRRGNTDDVIAEYSADYVRELAAGDRPFFLWASHLAPHRHKDNATSKWPIPAPRHRGTFTGVTAPPALKPSYQRPNDIDTTARKPRGRPEHRARRHREGAESIPFTRRIEALQSVDQSVARIVATLRRTGELDNTYIFFVSDNGLLLGEHQLGGKNVLYREALEVPMLVRVPGATGKTFSPVPVTLVDLAPTIADLARARPRRLMDGTSFRPLLEGKPQAWRDTQLIQIGTNRPSPEPGWMARGVRTRRYTYTVNLRTGSEQLFDHLLDPYEVHNAVNRPAYRHILLELRARTALLTSCAGSRCRQNFQTPESPVLSLRPTYATSSDRWKPQTSRLAQDGTTGFTAYGGARVQLGDGLTRRPRSTGEPNGAASTGWVLSRATGDTDDA